MDNEKWFHERRYSRITDEEPDPITFPNYYKANRTEYILNPGDMLFIPSGWFHFVFSKDPDPVSGLNVALNFWYRKPEKTRIEENILSPRVGKHSIRFEDVLETIGDEEFKVSISPLGFFPPDNLKHIYPEISRKNMRLQEFFAARNPQQYISQNTLKKLDKFSVESGPPRSSLWLNWGNCRTIPHYDGDNNWLCQIKGVRKVIMIPNSDRDLLYLYNSHPLDFIYKTHAVQPASTRLSLARIV